MPETTKKTATKKPADHPTFAVMIAAAIAELKERKGSSRQAIEKYIAANYKVGPKYTGPLKQALKKGVEKGTFVQTKGVGASGSFRIAKPEPVKKPAVKKPAAKKTTTKKVTKKAPAKKVPAKKTATKKPAAKKAATKKAPAKKTASPKKKAPAKKAAGKVTKKAAPKKKPAAKKTAKK